MPRFGLIGCPLQGSRSPRLFTAAYNGKYAYDLLEEADFEVAWNRFLSEDYRAINVTAPFKQLAYERVLASGGAIDGPVLRIGATNLIVKTPEGLSAHNSDFSGVILSVAEGYFPGVVAACYREFGSRAHIKVHQFVRQNLRELFPDAPQALVVGCGGAGRAAAVAAAEMGFETALMNRTPEKAQAFADGLPEYGFLCVPFSDLKASLRECDLVIWTIPEPIPALDTLCADDFAGENPGGRPDKLLVEASYKNPSFTGSYLAMVENAGARYIPGTRWHLFQAAAGYSLMTGEPCDLEALAKA